MKKRSHEPNQRNSAMNHTNSVNVIDEAFDEDGEVLAATEQVKTFVTADAAHPKDLPDSVEVEKNDRERNFIGAKGEATDHYGNAKVRLQQQDRKHLGNVFQVMDVCRPLHSVSKITDNDSTCSSPRRVRRLCRPGYSMKSWPS